VTDYFAAVFAYLVCVVVKQGRKYLGYRAAMYHTAMKCCGLYVIDPNTGGDVSFTYHKHDLHVGIAFTESRNAFEFQNALVGLQEDHAVARNILELQEQVERVPMERVGRRIFYAHYDTNSSDSPELQSLASIASVDSEVDPATSDPNVSLMSVENLVLLTPGLSLYKCHIAGKAAHPAHRKELDNILYASWDFHNHFDGLHNVSKCSEIMLQFESASAEMEDVVVTDTCFRRMRVAVLVKFRNQDYAAWFGGRMKPGSEQVDPLCYRCYLFPSDADVLQTVLALQVTDVAAAWGL